MHASADDIATGHRLDNRGIGVRVPVEANALFSPRRSDRFCLLFSAFCELLPQGKNGGAVKLITPSWCQGQGNVHLNIRSPTRLHGVELS
jgi:hypothetical protein